MKNEPVKIILDTNLWISFLITKNYSQLDEILFKNEYTLIFSEELLEEFLSVIKRPKFRKFFSQEDVESLIDTIQEFADFVEVKSKISVCRDEKDNFLMSLSKDSKADFLITGDKDLLDLQNFESTKIVMISDFLKTNP